MKPPKLTQLEQGLLKGVEAANHFASVLKAEWEAFWQRDTATVLQDLNADVGQSSEIMSLNTQAGTGVNALLDAIDDERFSARAVLTMPEGWSYDGQAFVYTPPVSEPQPDPQS